MEANALPTPVWDSEPPPTAVALPSVPSRIGRRLLLLESFLLIYYWVAPALAGSWDYSGGWSVVGYILFTALFATLAFTVVLPLRIRLAMSGATGLARVRFHSMWAGALIVGLWATNALQLTGGGVGGAPSLNLDVVYTPFGAWPNAAATASSIGLLLTVNPVGLAMLATVAVLWASAMTIGLGERRRVCVVASDSALRGGTVAAAVLAWGPLSLISGCSACLPLVLGGLALFAPGLVAGFYANNPFVPWIGLAGLLFLASLGLTLLVLQRVTCRAAEPEAT